ncbi:ABC transporter substrate-binding protein [Enterococcus camelliae]|uniref:ABC transporter substrate-binding protein n=1 Tax=Enterococcus camelliae TaxID=453959 RepID=A0ABW5TI93_9ENTE
MKKYLTSFGIVGAVFILAACSSNEQATDSSTKASTTMNSQDEKQTKYPLSLSVLDNDGKNHEQTFEKEPERVVTNNLSSTELLLALGLKEKIVGIMQPDNQVTGTYAKEVDSLPVVGDKMTVSKEKIAEKNPDVVIGRAMAFTDDAIGSIASYNDLGIQTYLQEASNMKDKPQLTTIIEDVRHLGEIFNKQVTAETYAKQLEKRLATVEKQVSEKKGTEELTLLPIVAFDSTKSTFSIFNISESIQSSMLRELNVKPAIEGKSASPSLETIIQTNPDIILYVTADRNKAMDETAVDSIKGEALLQEVKAIKNDRVYTVAYDDFMDYGTRLFDTMEMLSTKLYGNK